MCLAVPGQIIRITDEGELTRSGQVRFGGALKQVSLAFVPAAQVDDYVLVHAGCAIGVVDPIEAQRVFAYLREIGETGEAGEPRERHGGEGPA